MKNPRLKLASQPGESEQSFRARVDQLLREERDREVEALRAKYADTDVFRARSKELDEALELAKTFSTEESARFINGMLDAIKQKLGK